jgi:hypothetical protein
VDCVIVSTADCHDDDFERQAEGPCPAPERSDWPPWARWNRGSGRRYTIGVEEELMLLDPSDFALVQSSERLLGRLSDELRLRTAPETHASVIELNTGSMKTCQGRQPSFRPCAGSFIGSFARLA